MSVYARIPVMLPHRNWITVKVVCERCDGDYHAGHLCPIRAAKA